MAIRRGIRANQARAATPILGKLKVRRTPERTGKGKCLREEAAFEMDLAIQLSLDYGEYCQKFNHRGHREKITY
jgi:hypothetical protein